MCFQALFLGMFFLTAPITWAKTFVAKDSSVAMVLVSQKDYAPDPSGGPGIMLEAPMVDHVTAYACLPSEEVSAPIMDPKADKNCRYLGSINEQRLTLRLAELREEIETAGDMHVPDLDGRSVNIRLFHRLRHAVRLSSMPSAERARLFHLRAPDTFRAYLDKSGPGLEEIELSTLMDQLREFELLKFLPLQIENRLGRKEVSISEFDLGELRAERDEKGGDLEVRASFTVTNCDISVLAGDVLSRGGHRVGQGEQSPTQINFSLQVEKLASRSNCTTPVTRELTSKWVKLQPNTERLVVFYPNEARIEGRIHRD